MFRTMLLASTVVAFVAVPAIAQEGDMSGQHHMHGAMSEGCPQMQGAGHGSAAMQPGDQGPASMALRGVNAKMHRDMNVTLTGNADVDFMRSMIPHHQGAIDMAKTVLAFGADPEVKKLAEEVIKAQTAEIAMMQEWLKKHGQ